MVFIQYVTMCFLWGEFLTSKNIAVIWQPSYTSDNRQHSDIRDRRTEKLTENFEKEHVGV
jgi:hypothetical protein